MTPPKRKKQDDASTTRPAGYLWIVTMHSEPAALPKTPYISAADTPAEALRDAVAATAEHLNDHGVAEPVTVTAQIRLGKECAA